MPTIRLAKTFGDQTSGIAITPIDDNKLAMALLVNGQTVNTDVAEYYTTAGRDAAMATCVADMTAAGYERTEPQGSSKCLT